MNTFSAVNYFEHLLKHADTDKVVVNRKKLKQLVKAAKSSNVYLKERKIWKDLSKSFPTPFQSEP